MININDVKPTFNRVGKALEDILGPEDELVQALNNIHTSNLSWRKALALKQAINNKVLPPGAFQDARLSALNQSLQKATSRG